MSGINGLDLAIIIVLALSSLLSLIRGFVREAISLVIWVVAGVVAFMFTPYLEPWLVPYITVAPLRLAIAFLMLFIATIILGSLLSFVLGFVMSKAGLSGTDRMIGLVFGFARGVLIVCLLIWLGQFTPFTKEKVWLESQLIAYFQPVIELLKAYLPEAFKKMA